MPCRSSISLDLQHLRKSIEQSLDWVVFEPNDERLWTRICESVADLLAQAWNDGILMGSVPEEAFFVRCDRTTMTQSDIDAGHLVVIVGVAPARPKEFVIYRVDQLTGHQ